VRLQGAPGLILVDRARGRVDGWTGGTGNRDIRGLIGNLVYKEDTKTLRKEERVTERAGAGLFIDNDP